MRNGRRWRFGAFPAVAIRRPLPSPPAAGARPGGQRRVNEGAFPALWATHASLGGFRPGLAVGFDGGAGLLHVLASGGDLGGRAHGAGLLASAAA